MEPNWVKVQKDLLSKISPTNRDIVQENAVLLLNNGLLYVDFNDICRKDYKNQVEKCILCLAMIYQSFYPISYSMKLIHILPYMKRI